MIDPEKILYEKVLQITTQAHAGQIDKAGKPYIEHPLRVAKRCTSINAKCVALLHDVIEDSSVTEADLRAEGIPKEIVEAVVVLTHLPREPREKYYQRVKQNKLAMEVKLADIEDNTDPERLSLLDNQTRKRLAEKYAKALCILLN